jgi:hypothetical protein
MSENQNSDLDDCVIARCGGCNRVIFAAVNTPTVMDKEQHQELARLILFRGCAVEHITVAEVQKQQFGCKCEKP